jgi:hypothetical protein
MDPKLHSLQLLDASMLDSIASMYLKLRGLPLNKVTEPNELQAIYRFRYAVYVEEL